MTFRKHGMINISVKDHERFKLVCNALGVKHIAAATEALNDWIDAHELEALEAMAAQATQLKGGKS